MHTNQRSTGHYQTQRDDTAITMTRTHHVQTPYFQGIYAFFSHKVKVCTHRSSGNSNHNEISSADSLLQMDVHIFSHDVTVKKVNPFFGRNGNRYGHSHWLGRKCAIRNSDRAFKTVVSVCKHVCPGEFGLKRSEDRFICNARLWKTHLLWYSQRFGAKILYSRYV